MIFLEGRLLKYFFQEICSSGGKQTIRKFSEASIVKNCHPRTSLILVCVKSVPLYHFKLAYVVLHVTVKEFFGTHF